MKESAKGRFFENYIFLIDGGKLEKKWPKGKKKAPDKGKRFPHELEKSLQPPAEVITWPFV